MIPQVLSNQRFARLLSTTILEKRTWKETAEAKRCSSGLEQDWIAESRRCSSLSTLPGGFGDREWKALKSYLRED